MTPKLGRFCWLVALLAAACVDSVDPGKMGEDNSDSAPGVVSLELALDDGSVGTGSSQVTEFETAAGADCVGGVELRQESMIGGICFSQAAFIDRSVGTSSAMLEVASLMWSETDSDANCGEMTDEWNGSVEVAEWTEDRISLLLVAGTHCRIGDPASCGTAGGTIVLEGKRNGPEAAAPAIPGYEDIASGSPICSAEGS